MDNAKKCSLKKHENIDAISYCIECNIFMCNKCLNHHNEFLEIHHHYNLNKNFEEIFTGICKEESHKSELNFFCKSHNKLCCLACICRIKSQGFGQHSDCDVCLIDDIKNDKKDKLNENIKNLEEISNTIDNSINELKKILEKINNDKEELKLQLSKKFTQIRNTINEREDKLLTLIDKQFEDLFFKESEDVIKKSDKLPNIIKNSLIKGKKLNEEWDNNDDKFNSKINDCIKIENSIQTINELNENINKYRSENSEIKFVTKKEDDFYEIIKKINEFGDIIKESKEFAFKFKFKNGNNYNVTNNGFTATKNNGGDGWNCTIVGDKEIPKNKISKWKVKLNNFIIKKTPLIF